jgi:hypothetical protein
MMTSVIDIHNVVAENVFSGRTLNWRIQMARSKVNKSAAIREALSAHPDKPPSEIAELLKSQGIKGVSATYVSNVKGMAKLARKARRAGRKAGRAQGKRAGGSTVGNGAVAENPIVAALNLVRSAGSLEAARQALGTVEEIGKAVR